MEKSRKLRSLGRRSSSILKIDFNKDEDTESEVPIKKSRRTSRRVSFAETYQVKEFPRDSPHVWQRNRRDDDDDDGEPVLGSAGSNAGAASHTIVGLDKLLTGAIQNQPCEEEDITVPFSFPGMVSEPVEQENIQQAAVITENPTESKVDAATLLKRLNWKPTDRFKNSERDTSPLQERLSEDAVPMTSEMNVSLPETVKRTRSPLKSLHVQPNTGSLSSALCEEPEEFHAVNVGCDSPVKLIDSQAFLNKILGQRSSVFSSVARKNMDDMNLTRLSERSEEEGSPLSSVRSDLLNQNKSGFEFIDSEISFKPCKKKTGLQEETASGLSSGIGRETTDHGSLNDSQAALTFGQRASAFSSVIRRHDDISFRPSKSDIASSESVDADADRPFEFRPVSNTKEPGNEEPKTVAEMLGQNAVAINQTVYMDETACLGMDETVCLGGGILEDTHNSEKTFVADVTQQSQTIGMEETKCIGGFLTKDITKDMTQQSQTIGMEETKCIGGFLHTDVTKDVTLRDQTVGMEETKCIGGLLDKDKNVTLEGQTFDMEERNRCKDVTNAKPHQNQTIGMEETKCIGGFLHEDVRKDVTLQNYIMDMEETKCIEGILNKDVTKDVTLQNQTMGMEETQCVGGLMNKDVTKDVTLQIQTVGMEETQCVGGFLRKDVTKDVTFQNQTMGMEETQCVGGFLNKDVTLQNQTVGMEETKFVGGFLNKEVTKDVTLQNQTIGMEETKCVGGFLHKDVTKDATLQNQTVGMEETKCVGGFLNKDVTKDVTFQNQTMGMEETQCVGGFLNKDVTLQNQTVGMEETKCVGGFLNKDVTKDVTLQNQTIGMEETKCVGGILRKDVTKDVSPQFESCDMEETRCVTGILPCQADLSTSTQDLVPGLSVRRAAYKTGNLTGSWEENDLQVAAANLPSLSQEPQASPVSAMSVLRRRIASVGSRSDGAGLTEELPRVDRAGSGTNVYGESELKAKASQETQEILTDIDVKRRNVTLNETMKMEETACLGGVVGSSHPEILTLAKRTFANKTLSMEETNCVGGLLTNTSMAEDCSYEQQLTEAMATEPACTDQTAKSDTCTRTVELSSARYQQLKETLILSKRKSITKTPSRLEQSFNHSSRKLDLTTPVKGSPDDLQGNHGNLSQTADRGYPADLHVADGLSESLLTLDKVSGDTAEVGIDDEPMPEGMVSTMSSSTVLTSNDTLSSGSVEASMCQNKSYSFINVNGPLTVEDFRKLMLVKKNINFTKRFSMPFVPGVDVEDVAQVLLADLTLDPQVKAIRAALDDLEESKNEAEENIEWLQKTLEDTQPQIFQDCVTFRRDEEKLNEMRSKTQNLRASCHKLVKKRCKDRMRHATEEILEDLQTKGRPRAGLLMSECESDLDALADLITTVQQDTEELDSEETAYNAELQHQEKSLTAESDRLNAKIAEKDELQKNLVMEVREREERQDVAGKSKASSIEKIKMHLLLHEWNLHALSEGAATFEFLDGEIELSVAFSSERPELLQSLKVTLTPPGDMERKPWRRLTHSLMAESINTKRLSLNGQLPSLPQLLKVVSSTVSEIHQLRISICPLALKEKLHFHSHTMSFKVWSLAVLNEISVSLTFDPARPVSVAAAISVDVSMGSLRAPDVQEELEKVHPGHDYLSRLYTAAKQLVETKPIN